MNAGNQDSEKLASICIHPRACGIILLFSEAHPFEISVASAYDAPLHQFAAALPISKFRWLSDDRRAQLTKFGNALELVANFGNVSFDYEGTLVPAHAIFAKQGAQLIVYRTQ